MQVRAVPKVQIYSREFELSTKPPTRVLFDLISPPNPTPSLSLAAAVVVRSSVGQPTLFLVVVGLSWWTVSHALFTFLLKRHRLLCVAVALRFPGDGSRVFSLLLSCPAFFPISALTPSTLVFCLFVFVSVMHFFFYSDWTGGWCHLKRQQYWPAQAIAVRPPSQGRRMLLSYCYYTGFPDLFSFCSSAGSTLI